MLKTLFYIMKFNSCTEYKLGKYVQGCTHKNPAMQTLQNTVRPDCCRADYQRSPNCLGLWKILFYYNTDCW